MKRIHSVRLSTGVWFGQPIAVETGELGRGDCRWKQELHM